MTLLNRLGVASTYAKAIANVIVPIGVALLMAAYVLASFVIISLALSAVCGG